MHTDELLLFYETVFYSIIEKMKNEKEKERFCLHLCTEYETPGLTTTSKRDAIH